MDFKENDNSDKVSQKVFKLSLEKENGEKTHFKDEKECEQKFEVGKQ